MSFLYLQIPQWFDNNGDPLANGKIYFYITQTNTPADTYTDATGGSTHPNPVVLDPYGRADIWLTDAHKYRVVVKTSADVQVGDTLDEITGTGPSSTGVSMLLDDLNMNGNDITGNGNINNTGNITASGTITGTNVTASGTITGGTLTVSGAGTINGNLAVKNGSTSGGSVEFYEDSDNGTNNIDIKAADSITADQRILIGGNLPTVDPSNSQLLLYTGTSTGGRLQVELKYGSTPSHYYRPIIGRYAGSTTPSYRACYPFDALTTADITDAAGVNPGASTLTFMPYIVTAPSQVVSGLLINVITQQAATTATCGIYASTDSGLPTGAPLTNSTVQGATTSAGTVTMAFGSNVTLNKGLYYIGIQPSSVATLRLDGLTVGVTSLKGTGFYGATAAAFPPTTATYGYVMTNAYSAGTLPTVGSIDISGVAFIVLVRIVSEGV